MGRFSNISKIRNGRTKKPIKWDFFIWFEEETVVHFLTVSIITNKQLQHVATSSDFMEINRFEQKNELIYSYFQDINWIDSFEIERYCRSNQVKPIINKDSPINMEPLTLSFSWHFSFNSLWVFLYVLLFNIS